MNYYQALEAYKAPRPIGSLAQLPPFEYGTFEAFCAAYSVWMPRVTTYPARKPEEAIQLPLPEDK